MNKNKSQSGYSLVEIVIYIAIFAALSIGVVNSFMTVMASFNESRTSRDLLESGNTILERMSREIRISNSIDTANSTLDSNPGVLQLTSIDSSGSLRVVKFVVSSGTMSFYENGALSGNLSGQNITVSSIIFRKFTTTVGTGVKIEMVLMDKRGKRHRIENFYDSIILRGDY
jgi:type II secretory pathway pseudopilin PulG